MCITIIIGKAILSFKIRRYNKRSLAMAKSVKLTAEVGKKITSTVRKTQAGISAMGSCIPVLIANGFVSTMFISPNGKNSKSTATQEQYDWIKVQVVAGFSATAQSLLETPTKSMTEAKKISKRYWQQQIGARLGDFKGALEKREGGGNGKGGKPRTPEQRVRDNLNDCLKVINAVEDPKQLTKGEDIIALVKKAIALLPSK
jgi:hypothetical protein|tara:strand:- start:101 stop:706 length:606 start_codon:yes stop_codon:yes gene_type:complete